LLSPASFDLNISQKSLQFIETFLQSIARQSAMADDSSKDALRAAILDLAKRTENLLSRQASDPGRRMLVALAGVPGAGKSTVSDALITELTARGNKDVAVVPMVGAGRNQRCSLSNDC
jgi:putative protein kinase ArgK-like GTPase of G3E family